MDTICRSFPVNPRPGGGAPVNTHYKSPIDATRALIVRALVLMTLDPFERVAVSLKTRQYAASQLLSSRVPCLRCLFHANKFIKDL